MKARLTDFSLGNLHTIRLAKREACLCHFDPARVHGYCSKCPNHGTRWSCPPFKDSPLDRVANWSHMVAVGRKVPLQFAEVPSNPENARAWAIERFHASRAEFREILLEVENAFPGSSCLVAGYCVRCTACSRETGQPCRFPEALRFSLEAVGFDVSTLAADILGLSVQWPSRGLPEYYLTVGAVLCGEGEAEFVLRALEARFGK